MLRNNYFRLNITRTVSAA